MGTIDMKSIFGIAFSVLFTISAWEVQAQELWNGFKAGMSEREVEALDPATEKVSDAKPLSNGAQERLRSTNATLFGDDYQTHYYFRDGLVQITLSHSDVPGSREAALKLYEQVLGLLKQEYGQPIHRAEPPKEGFIQTNVTDWRTRDGVTVTLYGITGLSTFMNVIFKSPSW